jgi:hypothetical protein
MALIALAVGWPGAEAATDSSDAVLVAHSSMPQDHAFEGGRTACRRCHIKQFRSWEATSHAKAFETLPEESQSDPTCLKCHTTGYGASTGFTSVADTPNLAGVTCESCHGAGADYKDRDTMQDRDASIAAGLIIPTEETCTGCHNAESPTFSGEFDYEAAKASGVHEIGG